MTAIRERITVLSPDLRREMRWPRWRPRATTHGVASVLAIPMDVDAEGIGAISLYAAQPHAFTDHRQLTALWPRSMSGCCSPAWSDTDVRQ